jgi:hypothetical protein
VAREHGGDRGGATPDLFCDESVGAAVEAQAARPLRDRRAEEPELRACRGMRRESVPRGRP